MAEMRRAESISISEFSGRLNDAVQSAIAQNERIKAAQVEFSFRPNPGIFGFVLRDPGLSELKLSELAGIADQVVAGIPELAGLEERALVLRGGDITMGFFPSAELKFRE